MIPFGIVDTHVHFWDITLESTVWPTPDFARIYRSFGPEEFARAVKRVGVVNGVLVESGMTPEFNAFMARTADASPLIGGIAPWIDLTSPTLDKELDEWSKHPKLKAVRARFEGEPDPDILIRDSTIEGLRQVAARGLVFEFLVGAAQLGNILKVYERVPELKGIIEHMGKPDIKGGRDWADWQAQMQTLARNTPVTCKLSLGARLEDLEELRTNPGHGWNVELLKPYVQWLVEQFGPGRLMWGSDWPLILLESDYAGAVETMRQALGPIDPGSSDDIFRRTALLFYNLSAG